MRLDAMCCEVSLSHWIELGRLTAAPRRRRRKSGSSAGQGPPSSAGAAATLGLLISPGTRWVWGTGGLLFAVVSVWVWHRRMWGFPTNDWSDAGIAHVNKRLGRSYRNVIKMHLFDWDLGLCKEAQNSPWAVLYNRIVVGWNKSPQNSDSDLMWLYRYLWPLKSCICACSKVESSYVVPICTSIWYLTVVLHLCFLWQLP